MKENIKRSCIILCSLDCRNVCHIHVTDSAWNKPGLHLISISVSVPWTTFRVVAPISYWTYYVSLLPARIMFKRTSFYHIFYKYNVRCCWVQLERRPCQVRPVLAICLQDVWYAGHHLFSQWIIAVWSWGYCEYVNRHAGFHSPMTFSMAKQMNGRGVLHIDSVCALCHWIHITRCYKSKTLHLALDFVTEIWGINQTYSILNVMGAPNQTDHLSKMWLIDLFLPK